MARAKTGGAGNARSAATQQSSQESDLKLQTAKVGGGIVQPASGFPDDLLIEPLAKPIINESATSTDGKTVTAERSYASAYPMAAAYGIAKNYLGGKKSWQITALASQNPAQQESFEAKKYGYDAVLVFNAGDGKHALVTITVTSAAK